MTERTRPLFLILLLGLVALLAAIALYLGRDEYQELARRNGEEIGVQTTADEKIGPGRLRIGEKERAASALGIAALQPVDAGLSTPVQGVVVDLRTLVEARGRYLTQSAEIRALRVTATNLETEARRARSLFEDDRNVSERAALQAEAEARAARERLAAAETALRALIESLTAEWGGTLTDAALGGSANFKALLEGREVLALVSFPRDDGAARGQRTLLVEPAGGGVRTQATLVGPAPLSLAGASGPTYFCRLPAAGMRVGTRLSGHVAGGASKTAGVVVPESAVVWFAGRAWVYARDEKDPDVFERTPVDATRLVPGGWFDAGELEPGREVVVTGAQLLLSEELEYQIRNENED